MSSDPLENPFNDVDWQYDMHAPRKITDSSRISTMSPPQPPELTICLGFATQIFCWSRNGNYIRSLEPCFIEIKEFKMDINLFPQKSSIEQAVNTMFMNTDSGVVLWSDLRLWLVSTLSESILSSLHPGISSDVIEIIYKLDVIREIHQMMNEDEDEDEDEGEDEDVELNFALQESFEDEQLAICPAPTKLVERLVNEVYQVETEAIDCRICLEEFIAGMEVKRLPCSHRFHGECIVRWFEEKDSCPICRSKLKDQA